MKKVERKKWLQIPVSEEEHRQASELAALYDTSISELVRDMLQYTASYRPALVRRAKVE